MSIRVHELAKRCGLSNKDMIDKLHAMNYPVKSHSSTVDKITAESIENEYGYVPPPPAPPAAALSLSALLWNQSERGQVALRHVFHSLGKVAGLAGPAGRFSELAGLAG